MEFDSFIKVFDSYLYIDSGQPAYSLVGGLGKPVVAQLTGKSIGDGQYPFLHRPPLLTYTMDLPKSIESPQSRAGLEYLARNNPDHPNQDEIDGLWQLKQQGNIRIPRLTHIRPDRINSFANNTNSLSQLVDSITDMVPMRVEEYGVMIDPEIGIGEQTSAIAYNYGGDDISILATEPPKGYRVRNLAELVTDEQVLVEAMEGLIMQRIVEEKKEVPTLYETALNSLTETGPNGSSTPPVRRILNYLLNQMDHADNQSQQTLGRQVTVNAVNRRSFATHDRNLYAQTMRIARELFDEIHDYELDKKHNTGYQINEMLRLLSSMRLIIPESIRRYSQDLSPSSGKEMQTELGINPNSIGLMFGRFYRIGQLIQSKPVRFEEVQQQYAMAGMFLIGDKRGEMPRAKPTASFYDDIMGDRVWRVTAAGSKVMGSKVMIEGNYVTKNRAEQTMNIYGLKGMMQFIHEINFLSSDEFDDELARKVRFV